MAFVVNSTGDAPDAAATPGVCDTGALVGTAPECTLRAAIQEANASPGTDTIHFNIPGDGPHTIQPATALPAIAESVVVDGYSEPGASANTLAEGSNAVLLIELSGASTPSSAGLAVTGGGSTIRGLAINGFNTGISISTAGGNSLQGNHIGTNAAGTAARSNIFGVLVNGASNNAIGGADPGARNLISGNTFGVALFGTGATGNVLQGNYLGTDAAGTAAVPNTTGVYNSSAPNNTIGGTGPGAGNLISGNREFGVYLGDATGNSLEGNFIGINAAGAAALPNNLYGVNMWNASNNTIGGSGAGAGNVISGNGNHGVIMGGQSTGNVVEGNYIGTDAAGVAAVPNSSMGVYLYDTTNNTIGGSGSGAGNVISGNGNYGVFIQGQEATGNSLQGNFIGTDAAGAAAVPNYVGVYIEGAANNAIGGTGSGAGNTIAFNGSRGVSVSGASAVGNAIVGNSLLGNGDLGIDLGNNGVTPNDPQDPDSGPNNLQNYPVLTAPTSASSPVAGTLNSTPDSSFRIEIFGNAACDGSGNGEGEQFLKAVTVTTDAEGNASFTEAVESGAAADKITATATRLVAGQPTETSELSNCVVPPRTLDVDKAGTGSGTVTSDPAGINCGEDCTQDYDDGTDVTLTATPGDNAEFTGWSGACTNATGTCTVTMDQAREVTATFALDTYALSVTRRGPGTVTSDPAGIDCGQDCAQSYDPGTEVTLTATPGDNATFTGWSGACSNAAGACTVTMDQVRNVTARFARNLQSGPCKGFPRNSRTARAGGGMVIVGTAGNDELIGTAGEDIICGRGGNDTMRGRGGNDVLSGARGADTIAGGDGRDRIPGGRGSDRIEGGDHDDILYGGDSNDRIYGGGGADTVYGDAGHDIVDGGRGTDRIYGGGRNDLLKGGGGDDRIQGDGGADLIYGDTGNDDMSGNAGNDMLQGCDGMADVLRGGSGSDTARYDHDQDTRRSIEASRQCG